MQVNNWAVAELAYLAGMVDADGTVYLRVDPRNGKLSLRLSVVNTDRTIIDWLLVHFGGHAYTSGSTGSKRQIANPIHKPLHHWHLGDGPAVPVLDAIAPYMVVKKARAELGVEAWNNRTPTAIKDRRKPLPESVVALRADYVERMHAFNKKGA